LNGRLGAVRRSGAHLDWKSRTDARGSARPADERVSRSAMRDLPQVAAATTFVAVVPIAACVALRAFRLISSPWLSMALVVALSFAASAAGSAYWSQRRQAGELLFNELLLWGYVRRWRQDRRLERAIEILGLGRSDAAGADELLPLTRRERLLRQLADALESQDPYLRGHSRRVARHSAMIARGLGLPDEEVARVRAAAVVHDVGKLRIPPPILDKPCRLTDAEFEVIKLHPVDGAEMAAALGDPKLTAIVRHHHERLDGTGYPDRLAGEMIPLGARIIAVADTFDALTSARAYRGAAQHKSAIDVLRKESSSHLDPAAVQAFLQYYADHRLTLGWATLSAAVRRVISWLNGDPATAAPISSGKLASTVLVTAAIGGAAAVTPIASVAGPSLPAAASGISGQRAAAAIESPSERRGAQEQSTPERGRSEASRVYQASGRLSLAPQAHANRGAAGLELINIQGHAQIISLNTKAQGGATSTSGSSSGPISAPPASSNGKGTSPGGLETQASGTATAASGPTTQDLGARTQHSRPRHREGSDQPGRETGNRSTNGDGAAAGTGRTSAGWTSQSGTHGQNNAYGAGNGAEQGNVHGQGNGPEQSNAANGPSNAGGQGNAVGQGGPGAQTSANEDPNANSQRGTTNPGRGRHGN
jgi:HD-GYP domain-containing protein (c-di-GMP phosphodiesterase class II)